MQDCTIDYGVLGTGCEIPSADKHRILDGRPEIEEYIVDEVDSGPAILEGVIYAFRLCSFSAK